MTKGAHRGIRPLKSDARAWTVTLLAPVVWLLAACTSTPSTAPVPDAGRVVAATLGAEITLAPAETAAVAGADLTVRFNRVVADSRCPTRALVQCVWAGSVTVELLGGTLRGAATPTTRILETVTGRDTTTIGGQPVRLVRVTPERETIDEIPVDRYRITLLIGAPK